MNLSIVFICGRKECEIYVMCADDRKLTVTDVVLMSNYEKLKVKINII